MTTEATTLNLVTAAKIAEVTPGTIRYWILTGRLNATQEGTYWKIDPEELTLAIENVKNGSEDEAEEESE